MSRAMSSFLLGWKVILLASALLLLASSSVSAVAIRWTGHTDYSTSGAATYLWSTSSNWNVSVPTSADFVEIGSCGNAPQNCSFFPSYDNLPPKVINVGSSIVTIAGLRFGATNTVIRGTGRLVITGQLVWNAGFFDIPVELRGASFSTDINTLSPELREHGLMGSGSITVMNTLTINSFFFNMFGTGGITVSSGGTLVVSPPYSSYGAQTAFMIYGAPNTSFPSPYPTITVQSGGTLNWNAPVRPSYPGDACEFNVHVMNSGTMTAATPACRIVAPLVSSSSPATTSSLGGTLTLTGTGRIEYRGGSISIPSTFTGTVASTTNNYIRFGSPDDQNAAGLPATGWTYVSVPSAVTVNVPLQFLGTTYLGGAGKLTAARLTYAAGAIAANVDISTSLNIIDNAWQVTSAYSYIAANVTLLSGSSSSFARTASMFQSETDYSSVIIRPYSGITVNSGASVAVSFLPLWTASSLPGTVGRVTNLGSISFTQNSVGSMIWDVYVVNSGAMTTTGTVSAGSPTPWDYPVAFIRGGVSSGTATFNNGLGFLLQGAWSLSGGSWSSVGSPTALLGWFPDTTTQALTFSADSSIPGIEIPEAASEAQLTTSGNRIVRLGSVQMSQSHTFCCTGSTYIVSGASVIGDSTYTNYRTLTLNGASFENHGTLSLPIARITALTSTSYIINRGTMNLLQQGVTPSNGIPTHLINYGTVQVQLAGGNLIGITSNGSITFTPNLGASAPNFAAQTLLWSNAFILNTTSALTMNIYQTPSQPYQPQDQIFPGSPVGSFGQYCYLAGSIRVQFQVVAGSTYTPTSGMAYQLMDWSVNCDGTFSSVTWSGLPNGLGVKILYASPLSSSNTGVWAVVCSTSSDPACGTIGAKDPTKIPATLNPALYPYLLGNYPAPPPAPVTPPVAPSPVAVPAASSPKASPSSPAPSPVAVPTSSGGSTPTASSPKASPSSPTPSPVAVPSSSGGSTPTSSPRAAPSSSTPSPAAAPSSSGGGNPPTSSGGNPPSGGGSTPSAGGNPPTGSGGNAPSGGGSAPTSSGGNAPTNGGSAPSGSNAPTDGTSAPQGSSGSPTSSGPAPSGSGGNTPTASGGNAPQATGGNVPPTATQINAAPSVMTSGFCFTALFVFSIALLL